MQWKLELPPIGTVCRTFRVKHFAYEWLQVYPAPKQSPRPPTWLELAHKRLDDAVLAANGWKSALTDEEILEKLLELNLERVR